MLGGMKESLFYDGEMGVNALSEDIKEDLEEQEQGLL